MLSARSSLRMKVGVSAFAALAIVGAAASISSAAPTKAAVTKYKVAVAGKATGTATLAGTDAKTLTFDNTTEGYNATCASATARGKATLGTGKAAAKLASITGSTYKTCSAAGQLELNIKQTGVWYFNATGPTASGVTPGTLSNITTTITSSEASCAFSVAGTIDAKYTNSTGVLSFAPLTGTKNVLTLSKQTGECLGLANNNDKITFTGAFTIKSTAPVGRMAITS